MAIFMNVPCFNLSGNDHRQGDGLVIHSQTGHTLVIDGYDGGTATKNLINYLKANGYNELYLLLSHPHYDHYKGLTMILNDSYFKVKTFYCYDPESIKFGIGSSSNGRAVKEDYNNFYSVINFAKNKGAAVKYLSTGSSITLGDIYFKVWRKQPTHFTYNDQGEAYAFINDGSLCCYFPDLKFLTSGDGPDSLKDAIKYFNGQIVFMKVPHHGNNCSQSNAAAARAAGCKLAYETNIQRNGAGSTGFTAYGTKRLIQQGVKVLMTNREIKCIAANGKLSVQQGNNAWSFDIPYTGKIVPKPEGWVKGTKGWWYQFSDGTYATGWNYLKWSDGKNWFYFDKQGWMQTGWIKDNGYWYYCNTATGVMQTGWLTYKGKKCYLEPKQGKNLGHAYCNEVAVIDNKRYFFDKNCYATEMQDDGKWLKGAKGWQFQYLDESLAKGWKYLKWSGGEDWFYFDKQGWMQTGWIKDNGYWYYLNPDTGAMETGWIIYKGKKCYLEPRDNRNKGHAYCNGTFTIGKKKYTFDKDCYLVK